tara:strand:- start:84 stop:2132 length:2049 start_codon:yes stop_codon:yes gene_type:complete
MMRIAIDVGGTFTDVVATDNTGATTFVKVPSTPANQAEGVMHGLQTLAGRRGLTLHALLQGTERIVHGMTVATNALLERKGARVGLLTTAGHRDVLEMREGLKPERYNLRLARPEALVPRYLRLGVEERIRANGRVQVPLALASVDEAVKTFKAQGVDSVAVCFLHAYRHAAHELAAAARVRELMPDTYVSLSANVLPQIKEYQRVSTTVVNAYVGPLIERYLTELEHKLNDAGYAGNLLIMLSHGGVAPVAEAVRIAAATVLSGPAGGVAGARRIAALTGVPDLIPLDMGGTSTDISLIVEGDAALASERSVANETIALPSLDIITLGAGGGSIAKVGASGLLQVGPQSAGAEPGPASYGRGGTAATVTDASVVLGWLTPDNFMGGSAELDGDAAQNVLSELGSELGLEAVEAAEGVHRIVNTHMAEGIRLATVRRGVDPRRFSLLGFGGAAGLHATELARMLEIQRVVVPNMASVLSAWGMLGSELRLETTRTHVGETDNLDEDTVRAIYAEMENLGRERMQAWFDGDIETRRSADMRYGEQVYEIDVPLEHVDFANPGFKQALKQAFEARHESLYTYSLPNQEPVLVNARVATVGRLEHPVENRRDDNPGDPVPTRRRIYLDGWKNIEVFTFDALRVGYILYGPAIVESSTTTVLLRPGDRATATELGWLDIRIRRQAS